MRTDLPLPEATHATGDGTPAGGSERLAILFVCHRFPFPPHGGKIRPFNMIRHLAHRQTVTVASLVRSREEAAEGAGIASYCTSYEMGRVHAPCRRCACLLACRRRRRRRSDISVRCRSHAASMRWSRANASTSSSCTARRWRSTSSMSAMPRRSSTSATWTRRSGSITRATSRSRCRWATSSRAASCRARRSDSRAASTCAPRQRAPSGDAGRLWHRCVDRLVSERRRQRVLRTRRPSATIADTIAFVGRMDYLPEPGMHVRLLRRHAAAAARAQARDRS